VVSKASDARPQLAIDPQLANPLFLSPRLAKGMANDLRIKIVAELNKRAMSPTQFLAECCDEGELLLSKVAHHFRVLERYGIIEEVETKSGGKRRGAVEHFFRAIQRSTFDGSTFANLPESVKSEVTGMTFSNYTDRVVEAMEAGTMDARDDRHFTWTAQTLDQKGWEDLISNVDALFHLAVEIQVESSLRMAESGEEPIPATMALALFESPKMSESHDTAS